MIDLKKMKCDDWYVDSGATQHMTNRTDWFMENKPFMSPKSMDSAKNGITHQAMISGHVVVQTFNGQTWNEHSFLDVWFLDDGCWWRGIESILCEEGQPEG